MKLICTLIAALPLICGAATIKGKVIQVVEAGLLVDVTPLVFNSDLLRQVPGEFKAVLLVNYSGKDSVTDGEKISCEAFLDGRYQYTSVNGGTKTIEKYDCAPKPRQPSPAEIREWEAYQREEKLIAERQQEAQRKAAAERAAMVPRVLAYQHQQASNGFPSFQLELGKRYLKGDGVSTNLALARHWLQSACTNGDSTASNILANLPKP